MRVTVEPLGPSLLPPVATLTGLPPDRILLVGGTVRDILCGVPPRDLDILTDLSERELFAAGFRRVVTTGGSVVYFLHLPHAGIVEATRVDSLHDPTEELRRRDFTVNAMLMDPTGRVTDPLGGERALAGRRLVPCSPDTFAIDPGRVFRLFRFESWGWRMDDSCPDLLKAPLPFSRIPVERFSREMLRALEGGEPARFFRLLLRHGIGREFLPELFLMPNIPAGPLDRHPEGDLFSHVTQVLERVAALTPDPRARFCALFHDIGKLATPREILPAHHGHEERGNLMARDFCGRLGLPASYRTALSTVCRLHGRVNRWGELRDGTKVEIVSEGVRKGCDQILFLVSQGDKPGRVPREEWGEVVRICRLSTRELSIDPSRLARIPPADRASFVHQRRVELLRESRPEKKGCGEPSPVV